jgi:hypothetical protein
MKRIDHFVNPRKNVRVIILQWNLQKLGCQDANWIHLFTEELSGAKCL